jgi:hypothetical protein
MFVADAPAAQRVGCSPLALLAVLAAAVLLVLAAGFVPTWDDVGGAVPVEHGFDAPPIPSCRVPT